VYSFFVFVFVFVLFKDKPQSKPKLTKTYQPTSCGKIISGNHPTNADHHGCPFRHFSPENLRSLLRSQKVPEPNIQEMVDLTKDRHFQVACTRFFEVTRKIPSGQMDMIQNPNSYYDLSVQLAESKSTSPQKPGMFKKQTSLEKDPQELEKEKENSIALNWKGKQKDDSERKTKSMKTQGSFDDFPDIDLEQLSQNS